jgi:putative hemolysin
VGIGGIDHLAEIIVMSLYTVDDFSKFLGVKGPIAKGVAKLIFRICGLNKLNDIYGRHQDMCGMEFVNAILTELDLSVELTGTPMPITDKPVVAVCNHPFGILDGLLILHIFENRFVQPKVLVHAILKGVKPLSNHLVFVNPVLQHKKFKHRLRDGKRLRDSLNNGDSLIIFPAGRMSAFQFSSFRISDRKWNSSTLKWICTSGMDVVPIFIEGRNSLFFYLLNMISESLGFVWSARELFQKAGSRIKVVIGDPIRLSENDYESAGKLLMTKVYTLKSKK